MIVIFFFFFFSSRRRHTRLTCDWSSDVCSSDLDRNRRQAESWIAAKLAEAVAQILNQRFEPAPAPLVARDIFHQRNVAKLAPGVCLSFGGVFALLDPRSEEHTSELQSHVNLVCR